MYLSKSRGSLVTKIPNDRGGLNLCTVEQTVQLCSSTPALEAIDSGVMVAVDRAQGSGAGGRSGDPWERLAGQFSVHPQVAIVI